MGSPGVFCALRGESTYGYGRAIVNDGDVQVSQSAGLFSSPSVFAPGAGQREKRG